MLRQHVAFSPWLVSRPQIKMTRTVIFGCLLLLLLVVSSSTEDTDTIGDELYITTPVPSVRPPCPFCHKMYDTQLRCLFSSIEIVVDASHATMQDPCKLPHKILSIKDPLTLLLILQTHGSSAGISAPMTSAIPDIVPHEPRRTQCMKAAFEAGHEVHRHKSCL